MRQEFAHPLDLASLRSVPPQARGQHGRSTRTRDWICPPACGLGSLHRRTNLKHDGVKNQDQGPNGRRPGEGGDQGPPRRVKRLDRSGSSRFLRPRTSNLALTSLVPPQVGWRGDKLGFLGEGAVEEGGHLFAEHFSGRAEQPGGAAQGDSVTGEGVDVTFVNRSGVVGEEVGG